MKRLAYRRNSFGKLLGDTSRIYSYFIGVKYEVSLTNEEEPDWLKFRFLPLPQVLQILRKEIENSGVST